MCGPTTVVAAGGAWAGSGVSTGAASRTFANGDPTMPEKSRFAGGFLGMDFLLMGAVVIYFSETPHIRHNWHHALLRH